MNPILALWAIFAAGTFYLLFFCGWKKYDPNAPKPMKADRTERIRCTTPIGNYGYWLDEGPPKKRISVAVPLDGATTSL